MPNVMVALPNMGGALCSSQNAKPVEISWGAPNYRTDLGR